VFAVTDAFNEQKPVESGKGSMKRYLDQLMATKIMEEVS
jgi:hypothetical protein